VDLSYTPEDEAYRGKVRAWFQRNRPGPLETLDQRKAWQEAARRYVATRGRAIIPGRHRNGVR
jgi:hypothetical protein